VETRPGKSLALWRATASDLSEYNCGECPRHMRVRRGCHGGGVDLHYADRPEVTDRCPRRHLKDNPDLVAAIDAYHLHGGAPRMGLIVLEQMTEQAIESMTVIDNAASYQRERKEAMLRAEMKAAAAAKGGAR
jgi:hypothetical protein